MATSPTTKSALLSGAAKDDSVGGDGDFIFNIKDLLANDPGGAAKVDLSKQFFFGDSAADGQSPEAQAAYLAAHHITDLGDGNYRIEAGATDFNYFVQIGNKGTWSVAHVDVTAPEPVVEPEPHAGEALFVENFDSYADTLDHGQWGTVNLTAPSEGPAAGHWWAKADGNGGWLGVTAELVQGSAFEGSIASTSGKFWLDTQNSPGGIDITNWFEDPSGGDFQINFDIGTHKFGDGKMMETAHDASLNVLVDGQVVKTINYSDFANHDVMQHISFTVDSAAPDGAKAAHTISFVDTTTSEGNYVGFALDSIVVNDWLI